MLHLEREGFRCRTASNGAEALREAKHAVPDLVVLDLMLPVIDGLEVCRRLRGDEGTTAVPIIMLTAKSEEVDRVVGLEVGADDYVVKPFSPKELVARVRALLRRTRPAPEARVLSAGPLALDVARHVVTLHGQPLPLTPKEFDLLSLLAHNHDRVLTHRAILTAVWGPHAVDQPEHLWVLISQLRKKIELDPSNPMLLISEPWVGYRLVSSES